MQDTQIIKTIKKEYPDKIEAGIAWFKFITGINNIHLTERQLQLMSFINKRGTISSSSAKEEFCKLFNSSKATISNMVSDLTELKLLVKVKSKTIVNPSLSVDFSQDLVLRCFLVVKKEEVVNAD